MSFEENHATFFDDVNLKELELPANQSVPTNQRRSSEYNQQLVFKLAWSTRNAIMISLIRYTEVLRGVEKADVKDQLKKINTKLYQVMLDLPLKSDTDAQARSGHSSSVSLDLDFGTKSQIAAAMLANHNLVLYPESASEESKTKMIKKNNDLVIKLIKLPFSVTPNPADEVALRGKSICRTKLLDLFVARASCVNQKLISWFFFPTTMLLQHPLNRQHS